MVEHFLAKEDVARSNRVTRSKFLEWRSPAVPPLLWAGMWEIYRLPQFPSTYGANVGEPMKVESGERVRSFRQRMEAQYRSQLQSAGRWFLEFGIFSEDCVRIIVMSGKGM